ncbi:MAG: hypothetical protein IPG59_20890 [Candidatus Melainabacteria bacterium]|nr:MAG: hypothetical protein IPG59_20890 [Candidatus Melainabacteria bacterium]
MLTKNKTDKTNAGALKLLFYSAGLGLILGGGLGYSHFLSEARDWGKTWNNYNDFVRGEISVAIGVILVITFLCWILALAATWFDRRNKQQKP